jgi:hypothetical protein
MNIILQESNGKEIFGRGVVPLKRRCVLIGSSVKCRAGAVLRQICVLLSYAHS